MHTEAQEGGRKSCRSCILIVRAPSRFASERFHSDPVGCISRSGGTAARCQNADKDTGVGSLIRPSVSNLTETAATVAKRPYQVLSYMKSCSEHK